MTAAEAGMFLALSFGADELGTAAMLRAGGREVMVQKPAIRWTIKGAVIPLYIREQKKSRLIRFGVPALFIAAVGWNLHVARTMNKRNGR